MAKRAGVIPYIINRESGEVRMLFMRPSDERFGGPCYQVAKGVIDPGDLSPKHAALREGHEELGLLGGNIIDVDHLGLYLKVIDIYIAQVRDETSFDDFGEETGSIRWMNADQFALYGRDIHVAIVDEADRRIRAIHNL